MPRVKRGVAARKKRRKVLEQAKGYWGLKSTNYRYAKEQVEHSLVYAYRDRKVRKRQFRRLWIVRINAAARDNGLSYNQLINGLHRAEIQLDRKVLADLAVKDPAAFTKVAERAKVKVTIMFRGREPSHPERGRDLLIRLAEDVKDIGVVESAPILDGRNMVMLLGPNKYAGVHKEDAETEDTQLSEEEIQALGDGEVVAAAGLPESQPGSGEEPEA